MALVRPAREVGERGSRACATSRRRSTRPSASRARACPGPVFVECPVDLLYPEALVREWYGAKAGKAGRAASATARGSGTCGRHLRAALRRRRARAGGRAAAAVPRARAGRGPRPSRGRAPRRRAERPVLLVGSQALLSATEADALAEAVRALGVPVYLSGMARGLLGAARPPAAAPQAQGGAARGRPRDPGRRALRLPPRLRRATSAARAVLVSANRSRDEIAKNRRPDARRRSGAPELFLRGLAARRLRPAAGVDGLARGAARARRRARRRDRRAGGGGGARRPQPAAASAARSRRRSPTTA